MFTELSRGLRVYALHPSLRNGLIVDTPLTLNFSSNAEGATNLPRGDLRILIETERDVERRWS